MANNKTLAIILAAGKGTRMNMGIPKPLVKVKKRPIISWLIDDFRKKNIDVNLIVNPLDIAFFNKYNHLVEFIFQNNPKGTGHAVIQALTQIKKYKYIYVFVGDCPFVGYDNISRMYDEHIKHDSDLTILTSIFKEKKFPYARIIRDDSGTIIKCIEEMDATKEEKSIPELFCSHYLFKSSILQHYIKDIKSNPKTKEIYFTDIINLLIDNNKNVSSLCISDWRRLVGLNTKQELEWIEYQNII
ncbi:MAG: hypothetical protein CMG66_05860 [Candidatus Marinimicrobia bacterium]|nr:hypothetical protein [Candidatus Neomarinimicrobiota bacterium]|tara:strand:+ start:49070 stop:49801 length:732 start_codon:yes stop_codon:yes gene_type:complete